MPNNIYMLITVLVLGSMLGADAPVEVNLLNNGDFINLDSEGALLGWKLYADGQSVSLDESEHSENAASSLRIDIDTASKGQGSVTQKLKDLPPNVSLILTAQVKSTMSGVAFLQVKAKESGKEIGRFKSKTNSGSEWQELRIELKTESADELSVECRFRRGDDAVGHTVWVTQMKLIQSVEPGG